jgi:predicted Fe-Mo cluster-binding NifX family protein
MRIAIPVKSEKFDIFTNTGHTPFFAIFEVAGSGMFKSTNLVELRENPRVNLEAEFGCSHEEGDHECDHDAEQHKKEHEILGSLVKDCEVVLVKKACKNSASVFKEVGVDVWKVPQNISEGKQAISSYLGAK